MSNEATMPGDPSLARLFRQLDDVGMSAVERERAKEYLLRADAIVDVTARAWSSLCGYARRLRAAAGRSVPATR